MVLKGIGARAFLVEAPEASVAHTLSKPYRKGVQDDIEVPRPCSPQQA